MKKIILEYTCENFQDALDKVNLIWKVAEKLNHHPDILLHSYKLLKIEIYTHETDSITQKDLELRKQICDLLW